MRWLRELWRDSADMDRRTLLKSMGALAAVPLLERCASDPRPYTDAIDTVVLLMMENRSFDHYLGSLALEGRTDVDGVDPTRTNPGAMGDVPVAPAEKSCVLDPGHGWDASHRQFDGGTNDGFARDYEGRSGDPRHVMAYHTRAELPALYSLADEYAICQRWYASLMTSTWPNRFYSLGAQSKGIRTNDQGQSYDFLTAYDAMDRVGRSWGVYYGTVAFSGILARNYPRERFYSYDHFFEHAAAGTLPNFTVIEPQYGFNDDHPPSHPLAGQVFMSQIYDALARSPQWKRLLFVITYDEHGGFYDHVPPPKATDDRASDGFDQLGFRVPSLVIGPYVKRRHVESTVFDHTSVLATLHALFGSTPLTARDRAANDLLGVLDPARIEALSPAAPITLPVVEADDSIRAPECQNHVGLARGASTFRGRTGQPELEAFYDASPTPLDRRADGDAIYADLLARAEARGLLRFTQRTR